MWSNVISPSSTVGFTVEESPIARESPPPPTRYKHATTIHYDPTDSNYYLYVYGGRSGTFALKDFWQLNLSTGIWKEIKPQDSDDEWPPRLQEHTLVSANHKLYMFGGECHHNSDSSSHVWVWGRGKKPCWEVVSFKNEVCAAEKGRGSTAGVVAPVMRRGHTAVVGEVDGFSTSENSGLVMVVYGGYRDLKGSVGDCWAFHVGTETWTPLTLPSGLLSNQNQQKPASFWTNILNYWTVSSSSSSSPSSSSYTNLIHNNGYYACGNKSAEASGPHPPARHNHSAVMYKSKMYVYGGMCDLTELSDFWVLDVETKKWSQVKSIYSPGVLKGHSAVVVGTYMYVFGGEGKGGVRSDDVWRFEFSSETFERLSFPGCRPCPRVFATASKLPLRRRAHNSLMSTSPSNDLPRQPTTSNQPLFRKSTSVVRFADTQHLVSYSDSPTCSDYSSMETINYVENPNYRHRNGSESFEMKQLGEATTTTSVATQQHPEYVLLIGGLETHKSAVFSKQDLVVWRLRVDCCCHGDYCESRVECDRYLVENTRGFGGERNFEVEF